MGLLEDKCHFFQCVKRLRVPTQFPKFEHEVHAHTSTKVPHYRICCLYDREVKPCHLLLTWDGIMILIPKAIYNLHLIYENGWLVIITLFFVGPCCELTFLKWQHDYIVFHWLYTFGISWIRFGSIRILIFLFLFDTFILLASQINTTKLLVSLFHWTNPF